MVIESKGKGTHRGGARLAAEMDPILGPPFKLGYKAFFTHPTSN